MASETQLGRSLPVIFIDSKCSVKLQIVYGLKMSKIATFGHSHHSSFFFFLHVHVLHVWLVATTSALG